MIFRLLRTARILLTALRRPSALLGGALFLLAWTLARATEALDALLLPAPPPLDRPIFILGNPRSGTTFLHRFLHQRRAAAGVPLGRMIFPARLTAPLLARALPLLERFSPARHHLAAAHETSLAKAETDEAAIFFRHFDGFFLFAFFWAFDEQDWLSHFDPRARNTDARDLASWDRLWRANLAIEGNPRAVLKPFSANARPAALLRAYPDAKLLYLVRDPKATIASAMSLVTAALDARFGYWARPEAVRTRHLDRFYRGLVLLYTRFLEEWDELPEGAVFAVPYPRLMEDFERLMGEICDFVELEQTHELREAIAERARAQQKYKSQHSYDLARFGLSPERIEADLAGVYARWPSLRDA